MSTSGDESRRRRFDNVYDIGIGLYNEGLPAGQWQLAIVCAGRRRTTPYARAR
jgi:hypothetical protein